jgi:hypothetical protein
MTDNIRMRLFWKVAIYYGVCFTLVFGVGLTYPEWMQYLPFGGLDTLRDYVSRPDDGNLVNQFLSSNRPLSLFDDAMNLISAMTGALIVMIPLRWVYMAEGLKKSWSKEVATSLLLLVVTATVYVVKYSLPLAFALTGIFAGVRYRTTLKSQSDAFFTFACIAVGLAAGTRSLGVALVLAVFFTLTMLAAPPGCDD